MPSEATILLSLVVPKMTRRCISCQTIAGLCAIPPAMELDRVLVILAFVAEILQ